MTSNLKSEHRIIERALNTLEDLSLVLQEKNQGVPPETLEEILDFIRNFMEKCHHIKEEKILFPLLERRGISSRNGLIRVILEEHRLGRSFMNALSVTVEEYERGRMDAGPEIVRNVRDFVELFRQHIYKEENILFILAEQAMHIEDKDTLRREFNEIESTRRGGTEHHELEVLLQRLEKQSKALAQTRAGFCG